MTSPVTEQEMVEITGFFSTIATKLVGLSEQVRELYALKEEMESLKGKIDLLERQNSDLRDHASYLENDLHETRSRLESTQRENADYQHATQEALDRETV